MDTVSREKMESEKRRNLALIVHKLQAGIILTSTEMHFIRQHAPAYYTQAMRRQRAPQAKNAGRCNIASVSPAKPIKTI